MAADPLQQALRLRRLAAVAAQRELVAAIGCERAAAAVLTAANQAIHREIEAASRPEADDAAVEALGPWLRQGRAAAARAEAVLTEAETTTGRARAMLAAARTAEESVAALIAARGAEAAAHAERRAQAALDEAALRRHVGRPAPRSQHKA